MIYKTEDDELNFPFPRRNKPVIDKDEVCDIITNALKQQDGFAGVDRSDFTLIRFQGVVDVFKIAEAIADQLTVDE
jgi:hypothetical protein